MISSVDISSVTGFNAYQEDANGNIYVGSKYESNNKYTVYKVNNNYQLESLTSRSSTEMQVMLNMLDASAGTLDFENNILYVLDTQRRNIHKYNYNTNSMITTAFPSSFPTDTYTYNATKIVAKFDNYLYFISYKSGGVAANHIGLFKINVDDLSLTRYRIYGAVGSNISPLKFHKDAAGDVYLYAINYINTKSIIRIPTKISIGILSVDNNYGRDKEFAIGSTGDINNILPIGDNICTDFNGVTIFTTDLKQIYYYNIGNIINESFTTKPMVSYNHILSSNWILVTLKKEV